jgi:two-component system sensor histidine kinase/response regulator
MSRSPGAGETSAPVKVILADDSAAIRLLARKALAGRAGFDLVGEARDGAEVLTLVEADQPDCVVLDVDMPGMGGFETLSELRRRCPTVPVVMLSGFSSEAVAGRAAKGGAAAFLHKNELTRLAEIIHEVTSRPVPTVPAADETGPLLNHPPTIPQQAAAPVDDLAADELRQFEYLVSHDFAEPLRAMRGFANLLAGRYTDVLDSSGALFLDHIISAAGRMQAMVDDLLSYSRAGRSEAATGRVDLNDAVAIALAGLPSEIHGRVPVVDVTDLPDVAGDRIMCVSILRHLVLNGLTFNQSPVPTVRIDGKTEGSSVVVMVSDNGIGIGADQHELIFGLFRRLNNHDEYPGTGTGLALCRRMVALQGGTLDLESSTDAGTAFRLTLPRFDPDQGVF